MRAARGANIGEGLGKVRGNFPDDFHLSPQTRSAAKHKCLQRKRLCAGAHNSHCSKRAWSGEAPGKFDGNFGAPAAKHFRRWHRCCCLHPLESHARATFGERPGSLSSPAQVAGPMLPEMRRHPISSHRRPEQSAENPGHYHPMSHFLTAPSASKIISD